MKLRYVSYALIVGAILINLINKRSHFFEYQTAFWLVAILFLSGGVVYFLSYTLERGMLQKDKKQSPFGNIMWTVGGLLVIVGAFLKFVGSQWGLYILIGGFSLAIIGWIITTFFNSNSDREQDEDLLDP